MASIIFLTGVPASGKTTIARELFDQVQKNHELCKNYTECVVLDGDMLRTLWPELTMSNEDRKTNVLRTARLAGYLSRQLYDVLIVIALIAPVKEVREEAYDIIERLGHPERFLEVYVHAPLEERLERDPKGLYEKALKGEIQGLTGLDGPYEAPIDSGLEINTSRCSPYEAATKILQIL